VASTSTHTDAAGGTWFQDDVIQLREWASNVVHRLPSTVRECTVGAADTCLVQLHDASGQVSRLHARLTCEMGRWTLADAGSKNGILIERSQYGKVELRPGAEVQIGAITLIAESAAAAELRRFLCRLLGWSKPAQDTVNLAVRSLRVASTGNAPLMLCGDGDLSEVARGLHLRVPRKRGPFVLCLPDRKSAEESVRLAANEPTARAAIEAAQGGSICVHTDRLPKDFSAFREALLTPPYRFQVIMCAAGLGEARVYLATSLAIPPLSQRTSELHRIIDEYAQEALATMKSDLPFSDADHAWVAEHSAESIAEIEKSTTRLIALRVTGSARGAASLLGITHSSLLRWISRRKPPVSPR
jgi:pSer/pThr/pTyr-binding forkhead associated (FHA) protein